MVVRRIQKVQSSISNQEVYVKSAFRKMSLNRYQIPVKSECIVKRSASSGFQFQPIGKWRVRDSQNVPFSRRKSMFLIVGGRRLCVSFLRLETEIGTESRASNSLGHSKKSKCRVYLVPHDKNYRTASLPRSVHR